MVIILVAMMMVRGILRIKESHNISFRSSGLIVRVNKNATNHSKNWQIVNSYGMALVRQILPEYCLKD